VAFFCKIINLTFRLFIIETPQQLILHKNRIPAKTQSNWTKMKFGKMSSLGLGTSFLKGLLQCVSFDWFEAG
jgi:hypothetical protein